MSDAQRIYNFFAGTGTDHAGRTIYDYHGMSNETLELLHDYIQWAFPTRKPSQCQPPNAPLLDNEGIMLLAGDRTAMGNYYTMFDKMLKFYTRTDAWLTDFNHNHLRITRIIESSAEILGYGPAQYFFNAILNLNAGAGSPVNKRAVDFWLDAINKAS